MWHRIYKGNWGHFHWHEENLEVEMQNAVSMGAIAIVTTCDTEAVLPWGQLFTGSTLHMSVFKHVGSISQASG